jgi:FixJ family two-component response regulator
MGWQNCVFIVEDDYAVRDSVGMILEAAGFIQQSFNCAEDFLQAYCPETPGCLLLDINLPGMNGLELQTELIHRKIQLPIIFFTSYDDTAIKDRAMKNGANQVLLKPVSSNVLISQIQNALQHDL